MEPEDQTQQSGLPRPCRAGEAEYGALLDRQVQPIERDPLVVSDAGEFSGADDVHRCLFVPSARGGISQVVASGVGPRMRPPAPRDDNSAEDGSAAASAGCLGRSGLPLAGQGSYTSRMQRVLMISADPAQVAVAEAAMRLDGRALRAETSAEACLLAVREWRPDLLILDLGLGLTAGGVAALLRDPALVADVGRRDRACRARATARGRRRVSPSPTSSWCPSTKRSGARASRARSGARTGADDGHLLRRGTLVIDLERYTVTVDGAVVDLTFKEYELLRFLASNPGKPFTREALLNQVWGYDYYGGSRTVDVHVRRIRAKIERHETFV